MPRGRGQRNEDQSHPLRAQKVGRLRNLTPPNSRLQQNGTTGDTSHASPAVNLANSTLKETPTLEMSSTKFPPLPLLVGAVGGVANSTSSTEPEQNASSFRGIIHNQPAEKISLIPDSNTEVDGNLGKPGHVPDQLSSVPNYQVNNPADGYNRMQHRQVYLPNLLSNLGKKVEGMPIMDSSVFLPSWIHNFEKAGLFKAVADSHSFTEDSSQESTNGTKTLREEIYREKAARILIEQQFNHERQERVRAEQELERIRTEKQELEQRLQANEQRTNELQATLAIVQQALEEYHNSSGSSDWILYRDEILISENVIGIGAWGRVMEGSFRGCRVAVKQIHELILSPHNRRLFEREMSIAARCRHPCLLQFIGATNDNQSPLFVTEILDTSLRAVLHECALKPTEVKTIALDVARALNYLHLNQPAPIIHRDISSANVLLWKHGSRWRGKVSDYGTANFMQYSMTISPGAVIYSAPEARTSRQSPKVDTYSFGVLLCEMNIREFPDTTHRNEQVAMVTSHFFRDLIRRCLQYEPEERPAMAKIINLLEDQNI